MTPEAQKSWNAFVLMPFDDEYDPVYFDLIEPALTEAGFSVTRADLSINQQQILKDIVTQLAVADLVIVDVSDLNGNVMYELGLAHAMGRRTVMITRDISQLPFDLQSYRANPYSVNFTEAPKLKTTLSNIAAAVIDGSAEFSNPVQDFAPEFLGRPEQVSTASRPRSSAEGRRNSVSVMDEEDPETDDDGEVKGLLDYLLEVSEGGEEVVAITQNIASATEVVGERVQQRTQQMETISKNLGEKAPAALRMLMRETAGDFDTYSNDLATQNPQLQASLEKIAGAANGLARTRSVDDPSDRERLTDEVAGLRAAEEGFQSAYADITQFAQTLSELPSMEQSLNRAVKRTIRTINDTASIIDLGRSEFARARGVMEERLV